MNYIKVKTKKGAIIEILEDEFDAKIFTKVKEDKASVQTKEEKKAPKTKAGTISSKALNESKD